MNEKTVARLTGSRSGASSVSVYGEWSPPRSKSIRRTDADSALAATGRIPTMRVPPVTVTRRRSAGIP